MSAENTDGRIIGQRQPIRGPEDVDPEIRDEMCGKVTRAALAAVGEACTMRPVDEVADQLDAIREVRVARWTEAMDTADDRDFIDVVVEDDVQSGRVFLITTRNGFIPEAMRNREEETILQFKR